MSKWRVLVGDAQISDVDDLLELLAVREAGKTEMQALEMYEKVASELAKEYGARGKLVLRGQTLETARAAVRTLRIEKDYNHAHSLIKHLGGGEASGSATYLAGIAAALGNYDDERRLVSQSVTDQMGRFLVDTTVEPEIIPTPANGWCWVTINDYKVRVPDNVVVSSIGDSVKVFTR